ncbi:hypothetical protein GEMRC1_001659 [Eukaryota sp. GEM-RC1]
MVEPTQYNVSFDDACPPLLIPDASGFIHLTSSNQIEGYVSLSTPKHLEHPILIYESIAQFKSLVSSMSSSCSEQAINRLTVLKRSEAIRAIIASELSRLNPDSLDDDQQRSFLSLRMLLSIWYWSEIFLLNPSSHSIAQDLSLWLQAELPPIPTSHESLDLDLPYFEDVLKTLLITGRFSDASVVISIALRGVDSPTTELWEGLSYLLSLRSSIKSKSKSEFGKWVQDMENFRTLLDENVHVDESSFLVEIVGLLLCDPEIITKFLIELNQTQWMTAFSTFVIHNDSDVYVFEVSRLLESFFRIDAFSEHYSAESVPKEQHDVFVSAIDLDAAGLLLAITNFEFSEFFCLFFSGFIHLVYPSLYPQSVFNHFVYNYASSLLPLVNDGRPSLLKAFLDFPGSCFRTNLARFLLKYSQRGDVSDLKSCVNVAAMAREVDATAGDQIFQNFGGFCMDQGLQSSGGVLFKLGHHPIKASNVFQNLGIESTLVQFPNSYALESEELSQLQSIKSLIDEGQLQNAADALTEFLNIHEIGLTHVEDVLYLSTSLLEQEDCLLSPESTLRLVSKLHCLELMDSGEDTGLLPLRLSLLRNFCRGFNL